MSRMLTTKQLQYDMDDERAAASSPRAGEQRRRRQRQRDAQRRHRQVIADEIQELRQTAAWLRTSLAKANVRRPLTWREVALALAETRKESEEEYKALQLDLRRWQHLSSIMFQWVKQASEAPLQEQRNWRHRSLLSDPNARKMGYDWIMNQMYYNLPRTLAETGLPASTEAYFSFDVADVDDPTQTVVVVSQFPVPGSFEDTSDIMESRFDRAHALQVLEVPDNDTRYVRFVYKPEWQQNTIIRVVREPSRLIFLTQSIQEDDVHGGGGGLTRYWSSWSIVERVSKTCTLIKNRYSSAAWETDAGYVPLEANASVQELMRTHPTNWFHKHRQSRYDDWRRGFEEDVVDVSTRLATMQ
ncbi:hypothetical protein SPRG_03466 [Saprolegnia parasitica CBS 223.65]|uniref:Uncharacterized protein n=1 Tax=Saprolegnia parasitica (strain CBS 223.65) TaxID=695850 RepID=A0A067CLY2_SAPPC|nr:hypothetical protein SPRG_03466 [Saprolegnia parasitica CBS 223.65]KDO31538.1 hypothetical protein SPRG_03466 [Saprolegnia parasitica CBS 223.65]|eukprot:XP_012197446.1 hypothetical protein SPRG_03466 [Saprolegnia parasitica CBS 223.65]